MPKAGRGGGRDIETKGEGGRVRGGGEEKAGGGIGGDKKGVCCGFNASCVVMRARGSTPEEEAKKNGEGGAKKACFHVCLMGSRGSTLGGLKA